MIKKIRIYIVLLFCVLGIALLSINSIEQPPTIDIPNFATASLNTKFTADSFDFRYKNFIGSKECDRNTTNKVLLINEKLQVFSEFLASNIDFSKDDLSKLKFIYVVVDPSSEEYFKLSPGFAEIANIKESFSMDALIQSGTPVFVMFNQNVSVCSDFDFQSKIQYSPYDLVYLAGDINDALESNLEIEQVYQTNLISSTEVLFSNNLFKDFYWVKTQEKQLEQPEQPNQNDNQPQDPEVPEGVVLVDSDSDGFNDDVDNCPTVFNPQQNNYDRDTHGDACDNDVDNDNKVDVDSNGQTILDICLLTPFVDNRVVNEYGCLDLDYDGAMFGDIPLLSEFQVLNLVVDNCPDVNNNDQLDTDLDGIGDVCDNSNDLDFSAMMNRVIDPNGCLAQFPPETSFFEDSEQRPFDNYPVRFVINHSEKSLLSNAVMYDKTLHQRIQNDGKLRNTDVFSNQLALFNLIDSDLKSQVEAIWATPGVIKWLDDLQYDFGWKRFVSGNVSSLIFRDPSKPQWNDYLNYEMLNTAKGFKFSYTDQNPKDWALEVKSQNGLKLDPKVADFLPEFNGFLPVLYTNDVIYQTELKALTADSGINANQHKNIQNLTRTPLVELSVFPDSENNNAFMVNAGCSQRPFTSDVAFFQKLGQNSADYDYLEYEFDKFSSAKFAAPDNQRMRFEDFGFDQTPLFAEQITKNSGLAELAVKYFEEKVYDSEMVKFINTSFIYPNFAKRAFVRGCGRAFLRSQVEGSYDPRVFVPEGQNGWNLLFKNRNFENFDWQLDQKTPGVGLCPRGLADCDFVESHQCTDGLKPYVVMFKDLVDIRNFDVDQNLAIGGQTCFVVDPLKNKSSEVVAGALKNLIEDYNLDAISSDDYHTPFQAYQTADYTPKMQLTTAFRDWFNEDLSVENSNELFMMLGLSVGFSKSSYYDAIGIPDKNTTPDPALLEQQLYEYNTKWVDTAVGVRENLMCSADLDSKPYMAEHNWNPNISSIGHSSVMDMLLLDEQVYENVGRIATNITEVAERFFKLFATGFWDEKWNRGNLLKLSSSDEYYQMMKLMSAHYATQNGYMIIANQFFMFWNELPSLNKVKPNQRADQDTGGYQFQPNAYSLEQSLADLLMVQHRVSPLLSAPYRYHTLGSLVPDSIQDLFGFYQSTFIEKTWLNAILNYNYGKALSQPYLMPMRDLDLRSPNAYVMLREYENAVVIKNFGFRDLVVSKDSLPAGKTFARLVGLPILSPDADTFNTGFRASSAASQLFCPVAEKQNISFIETCVANKDADSSLPNPTLNPECYTACNSQIDFFRLRNKVGDMQYLSEQQLSESSGDIDGDGIKDKEDECIFTSKSRNDDGSCSDENSEFKSFYDYLKLAQDGESQLVEPFWLMELDSDFVINPGESVILYSLEEISKSVPELDGLPDGFYNIYKDSAFCNGQVDVLADNIVVNKFLENGAVESFKKVVCNDLFVPDDNPVDLSVKPSNQAISESCDANFIDFKCLFPNVFGMDFEYFKNRLNSDS